MEQQNQQPNQQMNQSSIDEQKRKKIKRIKVAFLTFAAVLVLVSGIFVWLGAYSDLFDTRGTFEGRLYGCVTNEECVLVQDGWCHTVIAVNKDKKPQWENVNARQTEVARQNRQTCKLVNSGDLNPDNFIPRCENSQCIATKKLDVGHSLPQEEDFSNWQTYRNEEFGFEVRYPLTKSSLPRAQSRGPRFGLWSRRVNEATLLLVVDQLRF